jgi:hypothetical protein
VKSINNFIGKTNEAINIKYGHSQIFMQHFNSRGKRGTVTYGCQLAALLT